MSDVRQITPFCTPPRLVRPSSRPIVAPLFHSFLIGDLKYPILLVDRTTKMPGNRENQVEGGDGGGSDGELQRLLDEGVSRCAAAGAGVSSQEVGLPGDEESPAAMNVLMTICPGFLRSRMGATAASGAPGAGQTSRRPVMLHNIFLPPSLWECMRPLSCIKLARWAHPPASPRNTRAVRLF